MDRRRALIVAGEGSLLGLMGRALTHPGIDVESAHNEQTIVSSLSGAAFDVAVVGGQVGKRGPLVLCDAVRARQREVPIVVIVGAETDEAALRDHMERAMPGVQYLDLRNTGLGLDQGGKLRATVLAALALDEDAVAAEAWMRAENAAASGEAPAEVAEAEAPVEEVTSEVDMEALELTEVPTDAPLITEALTDDDLAFAQRMLSQTRGVDFRAPPPKQKPPEGVDRTTALLRDKVRELERHMARMAHVYGARVRDFDGAAARLKELEDSRRELEQKLVEERENWRAQKAEREGQVSSMTQRAQNAEARLAESGQEVQRLRDELKQKEQGFGGMLKQAEDAFNALRDQSAQAIANYERAVAEANRRVQQAEEDRLRLQAELEGFKAQVAGKSVMEGEAGGMISDLRGQLLGKQEEAEQLRAQVTELREVLRRAEHDLAERDGRHAAVLQQLQAEFKVQEDQRLQRIERIKEDVLKLRTAYEERGQELAEREKALAVLATQLEGQKRELELLAASRAQGSSEEAAELRRLLDERSGALAERDKELAVIRTRLESKEGELSRLSEEHKEAQRTLERERTRSLEAVLDARLVAVEEFARMASERISRQVELLTAIEQRSTKQEIVSERLLKVVSATDVGSLPSSLVTSRLLAGSRLVTGPGRNPWKVPALAAAGVVVLLVVWLVAGGDDAPSATSQASAAATRDEIELSVAVPPKRKEPAAKAPEKAEAPAPEAAPAKPEAPANVEPAAKVEAPAKPAPKKTGAEAEAERKNLRRTLMDAFKKKRWGEAADAGLQLRASYEMDWEAEYTLADALSRAGRKADAIAAYKSFLKSYPDNKFADKAQKALAALAK